MVVPTSKTWVPSYSSSREESENLSFVSVFLRICSLRAFVYKESKIAIFETFQQLCCDFSLVPQQISEKTCIPIESPFNTEDNGVGPISVN